MKVGNTRYTDELRLPILTLTGALRPSQRMMERMCYTGRLNRAIKLALPVRFVYHSGLLIAWEICQNREKKFHPHCKDSTISG